MKREITTCDICGKEMCAYCVGKFHGKPFEICTDCDKKISKEIKETIKKIKTKSNIKLLPRIATINTFEEYKKLQEEFVNKKINDTFTGTVNEWWAEMIEVKE